MIGVTWTGWDGSQWDLRTGNVRITNGGLSGLTSFKFDSYTTDSAARDGQRFQGWRGQARPVLLPVLIGRGGLSEREYLALETAWWRTMRPGVTGTLTVTTPDGASRSITLRFLDDGDHAYAMDPTRSKLQVYALNMIADDPYWYGGDPWHRTFQAAGTARSFFGGAPADATYAWTGTPYQSTSTETRPSGTRTNLATYPSARSKAGWSLLLNSGATAVQAYSNGDGPPVDSDYVRTVISAVGSGPGDIGSSQGVTGFTPGSPYTFSAYVRFNKARQGRFYISWLNSSGGGLGDAATPTFDVAANTWSRVTATVTPPAGAVSAVVRMTAIYHNPSVGDWYDAAALLVEQSTTVGDYFQGSSGKGTPFYISSAFTTNATTLTNPGDVDAYPLYTFDGPITAFRVSNDGAVLAGAVTVAFGQQLVIDTSPVKQTAYLYAADGTYTNVIKQLTSYGFQPIKPGVDIKLGVTLTGAGSLTVSGEPRYFKAW